MMVGIPGGVSAGTIYANLKLNSTLDKDVKVANSKLGNLGSKMKGLAVPAAAAAAAITLVGKAAFNLSVNAGEAADKLLDLEQITGLSTVSLQEYSLVATRAGVSFDQFTAGIGTFERKLPEIMEGTGRSAEMMDRLGVSIYDGAGNLRDMDDIFPEVLAAMSGMESETDRNAMAMTLFGRNAEAMLPILALGADNMEAYRKEAHELGLVIGKEDLDAANNFRMEMDQLKAQLSTVATEVGIELIPVFRDFVEFLQWAAPRAVDFGKGVVKVGQMILWPFLRFFEAVKKGFGVLFDTVNKSIELYNRVADELDNVGIHMERLNRIDLSSPIEDLGRTTSTTMDDVVDDYNTAQNAMSEPLIPEWAGQTEYIRAELERTGARNIGELQDVYAGEEAVTPTPSVYTGAAVGTTAEGGQSSVSLLMSIDAGIQESNRLSEGIISAVQNIKITSGRSSGGFGGTSSGTGASEVSTFLKYQTIVDKVGGNIVGGF